MRTKQPMTRTEEELEEQARRREQEISDLVDELVPRNARGVRPTLRELVEDTLQRKLHRRQFPGKPEQRGMAEGWPGDLHGFPWAASQTTMITP